MKATTVRTKPCCKAIRKCVFSLVIVFSLFVPGCHKERNNSDVLLSKAAKSSQGFVDLPFESLANTNVNVDVAYMYIEPLDGDSIELWSYRGGLFYHPTNLSHRSQIFIGAYYKTRDVTLLDRAEQTAQKLMSLCVMKDGAAYTTFGFHFALHGDSSILFEPPWYSGMSQGELMMVLVRLYEFTGKKEYLDFAHMLFEGFLTLKSSHDIWIARLDSDGFYWIEEYPHDKNPGQTLNGYIAAVYGIYDYYRVTKRAEARAVYDMALTTIKHYLPYFRRKGETSYYCLGHKVPATEGYHSLHISMLYTLQKMTGDSFFTVMAETFEKDVEVARTPDLSGK